MSKYTVNKFMHLVNVHEWALKDYLREPVTFVARWEDKNEGNQLSQEERAALANRDYERLYALGAHPFLLWSFTQAIWEHEVDRDELIRDYKEKTGRIGYPDFTT